MVEHAGGCELMIGRNIVDAQPKLQVTLAHTLALGHARGVREDVVLCTQLSPRTCSQAAAQVLQQKVQSFIHSMRSALKAQQLRGARLMPSWFVALQHRSNLDGSLEGHVIYRKKVRPRASKDIAA